MPVKNDVPCLYCGDRESEKTDEHVLQRSLGAEMVLSEDVCGGCNTRIFSPLDKSLSDFVKRFARVLHPDVPPSSGPVAGLARILHTEEGEWVTVRLDRSFAMEIVPQLIFISGPPGELGPIAIKMRFGGQDADAANACLARMKDELSRPLECRFEMMVWNVDDNDENKCVRPALIRSAPFKYVAVASSESEAEAVRTWAARGRGVNAWNMDAPGTHQRIDQPSLRGQVAVDFLSIERAIAKIALNFVCKVRGPDVARHPALDPLREFARIGTNTRKLPFVALSSVDDASDPCHFILSQFGRARHHTIALSCGRIPPLISIGLYEQPFANVFLTEERAPRILSRDDMIVAVFDYASRQHRVGGAWEMHRLWGTARRSGPT